MSVFKPKPADDKYDFSRLGDVQWISVCGTVGDETILEIIDENGNRTYDNLSSFKNKEGE